MPVHRLRNRLYVYDEILENGSLANPPPREPGKRADAPFEAWPRI
jgi:hypothetical protein